MLQLRPYQQEAVDSVFTWLEVADGHPLIVLPTGTGKSLVLSEICRRSIAEYGDMKIVVVTHVMELIKQNHDEMLNLWPEADVGIYSAGIGRKEHQAAITFCGIQSVHMKAHLFQKVDFVICDESHLIPRKSDTMYQRFLRNVYVGNPHMKVIGLTATPFRMDSGMLHTGDGAIFDDICYEYPVLDAIKSGYLCNVRTKRMKVELNTAGVHTRGGEFIQSELQAAVDIDETNRLAVDEIIEWSEGRKSWLVFGSGVEHCRHLCDLLISKRINARCIFGDTPKDERAGIIAAFKRGEITALCSMGVLTTGFNAPNVDLIAVLRPTQSPGLYIQIVGRGMRNAPEKVDCLILDFARNIARHGPVDMARVRKGPHSDVPKEDSGPLTKECPACHEEIHLSLMVCPSCGHVFPAAIKLVPKASDLAILSNAIPSFLTAVDDVVYAPHVKAGKPTSLKATYYCGFMKYSSWWCFEHEGYAKQKACAWWKKTANSQPPKTVAEAMQRRGELIKPTHIEVKRNGQFDEIVKYVYPPMPDMQSAGTRAAV